MLYTDGLRSSFANIAIYSRLVVFTEKLFFAVITLQVLYWQDLQRGVAVGVRP